MVVVLSDGGDCCGDCCGGFGKPEGSCDGCCCGFAKSDFSCDGFCGELDAFSCGVCGWFSDGFCN